MPVFAPACCPAAASGASFSHCRVQLPCMQSWRLAIKCRESVQQSTLWVSQCCNVDVMAACMYTYMVPIMSGTVAIPMSQKPGGGGGAGIHSTNPMPRRVGHQQLRNAVDTRLAGCCCLFAVLIVLSAAAAAAAVVGADSLYCCCSDWMATCMAV